jgi:predicted ATPase
MALEAELGALAGEKHAPFWKAAGTVLRGCIFSLTGNPSMAFDAITFGRTTWGATLWKTLYLPFLAKAHAERRQFDDAWRCIDEAVIAVETTGERWLEAEIYRVAAEIALMSPQRDTVKAEAYFERALSVARQQQAKSWELRAAMSMARLWRDQGKRAEARDLLAPVYGWFTEGFDTLDLKEAKALLDELAA